MSKTFIKTVSFLLIVSLICVAIFQIAIDPLFQYHTPWFGIKPVLTEQRYQYAGYVKTFQYDNIILGNSFCENFKPSSFDKVFGGKTIKAAISGSGPEDWDKLLNIVLNKKEKVNNIVFNIDPYSLLTPKPYNPSALSKIYYLYDRNLLNDTNFFYNFGTLYMSFDTIIRNINKTVPDIDTAFLKDSEGTKAVIEYYKNKRKDCVDEEPSVEEALETAAWNLDFLLPYFNEMSDTQFYIFFTPVSVLYWDKVSRDRNIECWYAVYDMVCKKLTSYSNVNLFLWSDNDMLYTMSNIDNYKDEAHYTPEVCERLANRIGNREGIIDKYSYQKAINTLFDYVKNYDYDSLLSDSA